MWRKITKQWLIYRKGLCRFPFFRRILWSKTNEILANQQRIELIRNKPVITVAFMVMDLPCWKCDSLFKLMQDHPRFRPIIWIVPELQITDEDEKQRNKLEMLTYFSHRNYTVAYHYTLDKMRAKYSPDIVFLAKPYDGSTICDAASMRQELVCYVPYGYQNSRKNDFLYGQEDYVWRNFYATSSIRKLASSLMLNGGWNIRATGLPIADLYLFPENEKNSDQVWKTVQTSMKKVVWAPHWTVDGYSWFSVSSFLEVAEGMLQLAEKYSDSIQWAFKPHPLLRDTLYRHPNWGKTKTDAYYERWATMPNTQLETGAYTELFKQSDAMVHDSGSFIMEYLLVNKPCMYLQRGEGYADFNNDTLQALKCYHKGSTLNDVERFLIDLLNNSPDTMAPARAHYRKHYLLPTGGKSAAQNIVNDILNGR